MLLSGYSVELTEGLLPLGVMEKCGGTEGGQFFPVKGGRFCGGNLSIRLFNGPWLPRLPASESEAESSVVPVKPTGLCMRFRDASLPLFGRKRG